MDVVAEGAAHRNINYTVFNILVRCTSAKKIIANYIYFASLPLSCTNPFYEMVVANA